ncbi:MAG: MBL fold metallo-hydrolase [Methanomicrobiales archaeon]|nr:MBL fold metallo-hydrolase [Methanomicrobiales archaeon]
MPPRWIPGQGYMANSYIHEGVLIDAGVNPVVLKPYSRDIELIVLTHCHYDHTAYILQIASLCGAEVAIHRSDAPSLRHGISSMAMLFGSHPPSREADLLLEEGDEVHGLEVIHTPGHTPGSICLYQSEGQYLFSGDTVFTDGAFGRCDLPGGDLRALRRSIERLSRLKIEGLYPGHGMPVEREGSAHVAAAWSAIAGIHE